METGKEPDPKAREKKKRNRKSALEPFKDEIMRLWAAGKSGEQIRRKISKEGLVRSKSAISRFINRILAL